MADSKSDYLRAKLICHQIGGPDYARVPTFYLAFYTIAPTSAGGGFEVPIGSFGYARLAIDNNLTNFPNLGGNVRSLAVEHAFAPATNNWGTIMGVAILDAAVAGNFLYFTSVTPFSVFNGATVRIGVGGLTWIEG